MYEESPAGGKEELLQLGQVVKITPPDDFAGRPCELKKLQSREIKSNIPWRSGY
jgi:hypothetical protein